MTTGSWRPTVFAPTLQPFFASGQQQLPSTSSKGADRYAGLTPKQIIWQKKLKKKQQLEQLEQLDRERQRKIKEQTGK
jgi:hypothetical protein